MGSDSSSGRLRQRARELYRQRDLPSQHEELSPEQLIEELRIHQIELELQNQELSQSRSDAERARREAEVARDRYYTLFRRAPAAHIVVTAEGRIEQANERAAALLGVDPQRPGFHNLFAVIRGAESSHVERALAAAGSGELPAPVTLSMPDAEGEPRFIELSVAPFDSENAERRLLVSCLDVTQRQLQSEYHERAAAHYRRLLREMNHRVKNNLQILSSVVQLERAGAAQDERLARIAERIRNVSRIHTALYDAATDVDEVDVAATLESFVAEFRGALGPHTSLAFTSDVEELRLGSRRALALGLLVNELVTNAVRHAFPDRRSGSVHVTLSSSGETAQVTVADDGVGMPEAGASHGEATGESSARRPVGVGTELARQLARELDARWETRSEGGVRHEISFPLE
jgi:PAS domain S-box-containing protein